VGQNTNLGIILLAAPLAAAALDPRASDLETRLRLTLNELTVDDASEAYCAIRETNPGGLGDAPEHDVAAEPEVTLLEAMRAAEARDRIAWNYAHDFADIFGAWPQLAGAGARTGRWPGRDACLSGLTHLPTPDRAEIRHAKCSAGARGSGPDRGRLHRKRGT
jgi:triphosphoribosyl-dephospho-CoA synthase